MQAEGYRDLRRKNERMRTAPSGPPAVAAAGGCIGTLWHRNGNGNVDIRGGDAAAAILRPLTNRDARQQIRQKYEFDEMTMLMPPLDRESPPSKRRSLLPRPRLLGTTLLEAMPPTQSRCSSGRKKGTRTTTAARGGGPIAPLEQKPGGGFAAGNKVGGNLPCRGRQTGGRSKGEYRDARRTGDR